MGEEVLKTVFKTEKPVIGMAHFKALPGSPLYSEENGGIKDILKSVEKDIISLQEGGVDAIMFGNENDRPYQTRVSSVTIATMSYLIGRVTPLIKIPFGVDVLFDPIATIAIAKATGATFIREVFTGAYFGDMSIWGTNCAEAFRFKDAIEAKNILTMFNINAEFAHSADRRTIEEIAKSVVFSSLAEVLLISGNITGEEADIMYIKKVKKVVPGTLVFVNTGVNINNVSKMLEVADGAIIGTSLKKNGITWNEVDKDRVTKLMKKVKKIRK